MDVSKKIDVYRIYVVNEKKSGSEVVLETRTQTGMFGVAQSAFWYLYDQDFDKRHLLLMSKNNKKINSYQYQSKPGDDGYLDKGSALKNE